MDYLCFLQHYKDLSNLLVEFYVIITDRDDGQSIKIRPKL